MLLDSLISTTARAVVVALVSLGFAFAIRHALSSASRGWKLVLCALVAAPFLFPALLAGYVYLPFGIRLMANPLGLETLYVSLLVARHTAIALLILCVCPSPLGSEALHCLKLIGRTSLIFRLRGVGPAPWFALASVFLLAFNEFELASMLGVGTWTVAIFDAQTGGYALSATLALVRLPAAISCLAVAVLLWLVSRTRIAPAARIPNRTLVVPGSILAVLLFFVGAAFPLIALAGQAAEGLASLRANASLIRDIASGIVFAGAAAGLAVTLAGFALRSRGSAMFAAFPGLSGALVVSLVILAIFQTDWLRPLYQSPVPLTVALTVLFLPFAILLRLLLKIAEPAESLHAARMLASRRLIWRLESRLSLAIGFVLFYWAYCDVTASAILAPITMTPISVRLHNLMHYGQSAALSAMALSAFAVPVVLFATVMALGSLLARFRDRGGC